MNRLNICVAMSGGVDSTAAAKLLLSQGYSVGGAVMKLDDNGQDVLDASEAAERLGIRLSVIDCRESFRSCVIDRFAKDYFSGMTPNPCVVCNKYVKLGKLMDSVLSLGYDKVATGHYARLERAGNRTLLKKGSDRSKDQSYVLYSLSQHQLSRLLLPLGGMTKDDVRRYAAENNIPAADRPESQDICFVKDGDYASFIERHLGKTSPPGAVKLLDGTVLGRHNGLIRYTIGQRRGLGVSYSEPLFVVQKDLPSNSLVLGTKDELYTRELAAADVNYIPFDRLDRPMRVSARTRYHQKEAAAVITPTGEKSAKVRFDEPQRAVCAGQSVVFYDGDLVVGGGFIAAD